MYFVIKALPDGKGAILYQASRDDLMEKLAKGAYGKDPKFLTPDKLGANWDMLSREGTVIIDGEVIVPRQVTTYTLAPPEPERREPPPPEKKSEPVAETKPVANSVAKIQKEAEEKKKMTSPSHQPDRDDSI